MTFILLTFVVSFVLSVGAVALVLKLSRKKEWYDHFDDRKIHTDNVPRLGGLGFACVFLVLMAGIGIGYKSIGMDILRFIPCIAAMIIVLVAGAYDDFRPMAPRYKLLLQFTAALCVIVPGFIFEKILYSGGGFLTNMGIFSFLITIIWIVGLTNAFNLIDGVDGLAGGLSALIAVFLGLIFFSYAGPSKSVILCTCLFGVLLGFLLFNMPLPKAKIFMGDCGSQFLGLTLAILPLMKDHDNHSALPVLYAAAIFAIPIFDTIAAVWRRLRDGKKIYEPDRSHIHHKLIYLGLGSKGVIAVLFGLQIILGVLTYIAVRLEGIPSLLFLGAAYLSVLVFFAFIHFMNRKVNLRNAAQDGQASS